MLPPAWPLRIPEAAVEKTSKNFADLPGRRQQAAGGRKMQRLATTFSASWSSAPTVTIGTTSSPA